MADEGFHEIQLSGKHLVALFLAGTVVAVVIFLCGVIVGRDIYKQRVALAQAASEVPTDPTAGPPMPDPTQPVPPSQSLAPPTVTQEPLSYPDRLAGVAPPVESLKPAPSPPAPERPRAPEARAPAPRAPATLPPAVRTSGGRAPAVRASPSAKAPDASSASAWTVQVAAVGERGEADAIARRLSSKGYQSYVVSPASGTPRVFRVRVGKFKERREAEQVAGRLRKEEQFNTWVTR